MNKYQRAAKHIIDDLRKNQSLYSQATIDRALKALEGLKAKIEEVRQPVEIPENVDILYMLAGGKPQAFLDYARQVPVKEINDLARNPQALQNVLRQLQSKITLFPQQKDGIPQADLQSSNVYGYQYDPSSGSLKVRFQNGGIYEYDDVPPFIYKLFSDGAIPAKTEGENEYGAWWIGKRPSIGSSLNYLLKNGAYRYTKLN